MMQTIELRTAPEVRRAVVAAFPNYRKHNAFLSVFPESGLSVNSYWDGGSKTYYAVIDLVTLKTHSLPTSTHPYFDVAARGLVNAQDADVIVDHVGNITLKHLPEGFAVISAGTFCGKPATAHVYLNPNNLAKLLTGGSVCQN